MFEKLIEFLIHIDIVILTFILFGYKFSPKRKRKENREKLEERIDSVFEDKR